MNKIRKMLAISAISAGLLLGVGASPASATTIDASSFAHELCGDAAFANSEDDGIHVQVLFSDGAGPFGGGIYDCATGELTF